MSHSLTRREFLWAGAALAGGALAARSLGDRSLLAAEAQAWPPEMPPVKIHQVYVATPGTAWPKPEFDIAAEAAKFEKHLAKVATDLGDVRFVGGQIVKTPDEAAKVAGLLGEADAVLAFHLSLGSGHLVAPLVNAGRPTTIFSQPFSGHEWIDFRQWQKAGKKIILLATSDYGEIAQAVALMRVPARMSRSRILIVGASPGGAAQEIKKRLGAEVIPLTADDLVKAHASVDAKLAEAEAETYWIRPARKIVEPGREEIIKSARQYLAMKKLMTDEGARAITINCLGGMPIQTVGYPCLGFSRLGDEGLVGACEADLESTVTWLLFEYAFGVPGFITDPLFDTSKNAVIHAHCVSPTRMDGPKGERAPYLVRTHRDDNRGASLEVEMRVGQVITCAKLAGFATMLISTGKIIEITDFDDRGCRTQITTQVANARKMMDNWSGGLHRVVFYGDRVQGIRHLGAAMGFNVVEET